MPESADSITVAFVALGCAKNVVDSEKMLAEIVQAGMLITTRPEHADVIVINTCGFIAPAKAEAIEEIRRAVQCKKNGRVKKVVVAGCLCERLGKELFAHVGGIDAIVGLGRRDEIATIIRKTLASEQPAAYLGHQCLSAADDRTRLRITPDHWAYLRLSEGCDHRCSFCTIPAIRGRLRSKPRRLVLSEAAELVSAGAVELNLIGQDITSYGRDFGEKDALPGLLRELEQIPGLEWIRLFYLFPAGISDRLAETIAASQKIVSYVDMPVQHINDDILRRMRRPDSKDRIRSLIDKLRCAIPEVVLRTTLIVGFPGETERQFEELVEFVRWAQFDALGCFKFYAEDGTPAARMPEQVPEHVKDRRVDELMLAQQEIVFAGNEKRIGSRLICLVDSVGPDNNGRGRFYGQGPQVDGVCLIDNCTARPGGFISVKVSAAKDYDLIVEPV